MQQVLARYPGAQRALFRQYHIGGCSSCGFSPEETLQQLCARNAHLQIEEVIAFLQRSQEEDRKQMIDPTELAQRQTDAATRLVDIRTREEFDAVHIPGSVHFTQPLMNEMLMHWPREEGLIALIDHQGLRALDAAAYFEGHGFKNVRALAGGIDAYAERVAPELPRYTVE
ncbi:MAG: rhodanese-like domain-containing protein [Verrucomicrobia bacterium]|nr:rhodanese-like domain-containing protein [Verrucomicrobiota bacterium]